MPAIKVWIVYEPRLYADLFSQTFTGVSGIRLIQDAAEGVDVTIIPLADDGRPHLSLQLEPTVAKGKVIALAPTGERALVRLPGSIAWTELRPFGMERLVGEVLTFRPRVGTAPLRPLPVAQRVTPSLWDRMAAIIEPILGSGGLRSMATAFASVAVILALTAGTVAASRRSLPGEWLYSLKRWSETAQLSLAPPEQQLRLRTQNATNRIAEIAGLVAKGEVPSGQLVEEARAELQAVLEAAQQLPARERESALIVLMDLAYIQEAVVAAALAGAPPEAQAPLQESLLLLSYSRRSAVEALGGQVEATPAPAASTPVAAGEESGGTEAGDDAAPPDEDGDDGLPPGGIEKNPKGRSPGWIPPGLDEDEAGAIPDEVDEPKGRSTGWVPPGLDPKFTPPGQEGKPEDKPAGGKPEDKPADSKPDDKPGNDGGKPGDPGKPPDTPGDGKPENKPDNNGGGNTEGGGSDK